MAVLSYQGRRLRIHKVVVTCSTFCQSQQERTLQLCTWWYVMLYFYVSFLQMYDHVSCWLIKSRWSEVFSRIRQYGRHLRHEQWVWCRPASSEAEVSRLTLSVELRWAGCIYLKRPEVRRLNLFEELRWTGCTCLKNWGEQVLPVLRAEVSRLYMSE
jgi:hypothetical protein